MEGIINKPLPAKITAAPIRVQTSGISPKKRNPKRLIQTNLRKSIGITLDASAILKPLTAARCPMEPRIPITKSQK